MGLFKKTKTETTKKKIQTTYSKIVKLSYLQSLSVDSGVARVEDFVTETDSQEDINRNIDPKSLGVNENKNRSPDSQTYGIGSLLGLGGSILDSILGGVFGRKKVLVSAKADIRASGWSINKVWNQPQFDIIRYAIGIKELDISQFSYTNVSEFVSVPWSSPKEISKIILNVDQFIPPGFPNGKYIKYYIKPNTENSNYIEINPIGLPTEFKEDGTAVPRVISFNVEKPINSNIEDSYIYTSEPVTEVIFKAVFTRPSSMVDGSPADGYSPILRSYRLLMYPKNGL